MRLRELNIRWPWLKIFLIVSVMALSAMGMIMATQRAWLVAGPVVTSETTTPAPTEDTSPAKTQDRAVLQADTSVTLKQAEKTTPSMAQPRTLKGKKLIALTFDDGPSTETTPRLLQILQEKQVPATFFTIGIMIERAPELFQQEINAGHEVGSHSATHANLARSTIEAIKWENARMDELFLQWSGSSASLMRPPYGAVNDNVRANTSQPLILWSIDPEDWKYKDAAAIAEKVQAAAFDGAIILLHDIYATTVEAVPTIIDQLRADDYEFVTVPELAKLRDTPLEKGWTYGSFRP